MLGNDGDPRLDILWDVLARVPGQHPKDLPFENDGRRAEAANLFLPNPIYTQDFAPGRGHILQQDEFEAAGNIAQQPKPQRYSRMGIRKVWSGSRHSSYGYASTSGQMEATAVVGTSLPEMAVGTAVPLPNTPNLHTSQIWTLANCGNELLESTFQRMFTRQFQEESRRQVGLIPQVSGEFHNQLKSAKGRRFFQRLTVEMSDARNIDSTSILTALALNRD